MFQFGTTLLSLKPVEFWEMRVKYFLLSLDEIQNIRTQEFRKGVELVRNQTAHLINIQLEENKKLKPWEIWPLEWDKEVQKKIQEEEMSEEDAKEHNRRLWAAMD